MVDGEIALEMITAVSPSGSYFSWRSMKISDSIVASVEGDERGFAMAKPFTVPGTPAKKPNRKDMVVKTPKNNMLKKRPKSRLRILG